MSPKQFKISRRACSPFLAAAAGAAVCLSNAQATSGNVSASNGGNSTFTGTILNINIFGGLAKFDISYSVFTHAGHFLGHASHALDAVKAGGMVYHAPTGVQVSTLAGFSQAMKMRPNQSNNYIPMRFNNGGIKYGWVHCVSTNASGKVLKADTWSYNAAGGGIKTLDESITPKKFALSDGRVKLNWSNANEDGVARYEVQKKSGGAWAAVDSDVPGAGSYAATVGASGEYRLVVENTDGATRTVAF